MIILQFILKFRVILAISDRQIRDRPTIYMQNQIKFPQIPNT